MPVLAQPPLQTVSPDVSATFIETSTAPADPDVVETIEATAEIPPPPPLPPTLPQS